MTIPTCDAAEPFPLSPKAKLPNNATDTHAHVFSSLSRYPYTSNRTYTPPDAPVGAYLHLHQQLGIDRGVLVQPSVYGTDNRLQSDTLRYLRGLGKAYKGVAVVDADVTDESLDQLSDSGHCGVRMNLLFKGGISWDEVSRLAVRLADRNWHVQFLIDVSEFVDLEKRIASLPLPVVIDHMGHMPCGKGINNPGFQSLLRLLEKGDTWVKLSGAYRISQEKHAPYQDVMPFAQALIHANPDRCLWGSDWPHPHFSKPMPNDKDLIDSLFDWTSEEEIIQKILVDNPTHLYQL